MSKTGARPKSLASLFGTGLNALLACCNSNGVVFPPLTTPTYFSNLCPLFSSLFCVPFFGFQPSVTLLKLNTAVGQDLAASLSLSLVDLLADHRAALDRVIIAAAVQPPKRHQVRRPV